MKKVDLLIFVFAGIGTLGFAKGNIELYGGVPLLYEKSDIGKTFMTAASVGFAVTAPISDNIGIGVYDTVLFPLQLKADIEGISATANRSDYNSIWGFDMLLGPVFIVYSNSKIKIPVAAGFHLLTMTASTDEMSTLGYELGFGSNVGIEFHINDRLYILGRLQGTGDFFGITRVDVGRGSVVDSGILTTLCLNPSIGIGFKL